jgi:hypothetical protein
LLVPLYAWPGDPTEWNKLLDAKAANPSANILLVVNPSNGPGEAPDPTYQAMISRVSAAGIPMLGYTYSHWGARAIADIETDWMKYRQWYPQIKGLWIDELAAESGFEADYREVKAFVGGFVGGNPGTSAPTYEGVLDLLCVFENQGFPSQAFHAGEAWVAYGVQFEATYLTTGASYFYMTDYSDYFHVPSYLKQLL